MRITYIIILSSLVFMLCKESQTPVFKKQQKRCFYWFQRCSSAPEVTFSLRKANLIENQLILARGHISRKIDSIPDESLRGVYRILYLAKWEGSSEAESILGAVDYFSLIFILVISGFHFSIVSMIVRNSILYMFGFLSFIRIISPLRAEQIVSFVDIVKLVFLYFFCQFYAFSPSVSRALVVEILRDRLVIANIFGTTFGLIEMYFFASILGVDIRSTAYFMSWTCYLIFATPFSKFSFNDIFTKTVLSSVLCLSLFGRMSLLSIPVAMVWSYSFSYLYLLGFCGLYFNIKSLNFINKLYWESLVLLEEAVKDYDIVIRCNGFIESSIILAVVLFIIFLSRGFKMEKNLWKERVF